MRAVLVEARKGEAARQDWYAVRLLREALGVLEVVGREFTILGFGLVAVMHLVYVEAAFRVTVADDKRGLVGAACR